MKLLTSLATFLGSQLVPVANGGTGISNDPNVLNPMLIIDGGGAVITTGIKGYIFFDFACVITKWTLLADVSGSIVVDLYKDIYANYPPTSAVKITGSTPLPPTISSAIKAQSSTLTGWITTIAAGDVVGVNVNSVSSITKATLALTVKRV